MIFRTEWAVVGGGEAACKNGNCSRVASMWAGDIRCQVSGIEYRVSQVTTGLWDLSFIRHLLPVT
jgi:hypothetical protein